jgi:alpha/beta hydrolase fold
MPDYRRLGRYLESKKEREAMTKSGTVSALGLGVFYREAGDQEAPKLLLLGGFPASSHQFRNLIPALADRFHVVSFDYPGFGNTEMPDPASWSYTFDHLTDVVEAAWRPSSSPARWGSTCRTTVRAGRTAEGNAGGAGSLPSVTVTLRVKPRRYHGGWRWLRLPARLCDSISDYERLAGEL